MSNDVNSTFIDYFAEFKNVPKEWEEFSKLVFDCHNEFSELKRHWYLLESDYPIGKTTLLIQQEL